MDDQERNREALIDRFAEQARIIRHRNDRIAEVEARANELELELAHAVTRAEKAEQERDEYRAMHSKQIKTIARLQENTRPLTPDAITDEMIERGRSAYWGPTYGGNVNERVRAILTAALAPARPEGAEKVEAVLHQYWSGDINGDDLADRIVEEMNR